MIHHVPKVGDHWFTRVPKLCPVPNNDIKRSNLSIQNRQKKKVIRLLNASSKIHMREEAEEGSKLLMSFLISIPREFDVRSMSRVVQQTVIKTTPVTARCPACACAPRTRSTHSTTQQYLLLSGGGGGGPYQWIPLQKRPMYWDSHHSRPGPWNTRWTWYLKHVLKIRYRRLNEHVGYVFARYVVAHWFYQFYSILILPSFGIDT